MAPILEHRPVAPEAPSRSSSENALVVWQDENSGADADPAPSSLTMIADDASGERLPPDPLPYRLFHFEDAEGEASRSRLPDELPLRIEFAASEMSSKQFDAWSSHPLLTFSEDASTEVRIYVADRLVALGVSVIVQDQVAVQILRLFGEEFASLSRCFRDESLFRNRGQ